MSKHSPPAVTACRRLLYRCSASIRKDKRLRSGLRRPWPRTVGWCARSCYVRQLLPPPLPPPLSTCRGLGCHHALRTLLTLALSHRLPLVARRSPLTCRNHLPTPPPQASGECAQERAADADPGRERWVGLRWHATIATATAATGTAVRVLRLCYHRVSYSPSPSRTTCRSLLAARRSPPQPLTNSSRTGERRVCARTSG